MLQAEFSIFNVKKMFKLRGTIKRKKESGGHNLKRDENILTGLASEIAASLTTSMRTMAKELKVRKEEYLKVMKDVVKPWIDANYSGVKYVWQ